VESIRKSNTNRVITIVSVLFALLGAFSLYQVLNWNLFPWLKLSIIFGSSFLCLIFALVVKIYSRQISYLILVTALIQFLTSALFLSQHEILKAYWQWMFFPLTVIFSMIFWDLFSRKKNQVNFTGRISCIILLILTFLKFLKHFEWLDYCLILIILTITSFLIFSKSSNFQES
jgi:hypothetical protein